VVIRDAIAAGHVPGPRLKACGPEITVTGGLGDERRAHLYRESFAVVADGPAEIVKWARLCCREGTDAIKLNVSGDDLYKAAKGEMTVMSETEIRAGVEVARDFRRKVNAHCRAAESVKRAVRCGVDVIYHCEYADAEALDLLEREKHRVFVGPAIGLPFAVRESLRALGAGADSKMRALIERGFEAAIRTYEQMRKRGIRVVIGGDYGFGVTPQGTNARDVEHFVNLFGYSPGEALASATRVGAELMGMGDELGLVREGYIADLLLVDGDPLGDVSLLQRPERLVAIMQNGSFHKLDRDAIARRRRATAAAG
jgi:imidazolonepropionase-like amidohydrolase